MSDSWMLSGKPYTECKAAALSLSAEQLARIVVDDRYNRFVGEHADRDDRVEGKVGPVPKALVDHEHGKLVPYIGWFWRSTDWFDGRITIGDCGEFIGVMENNKWDYPQRQLTPDEFVQVVAIVDEAMSVRGGGSLADENAARTAVLAKLWPLFQTFKIAERAEL